MKRMGWFLLAIGVVGIALGRTANGSGGPAGADDVKYLREQYVYFQALDERRQAHIRILDAEFHKLDPPKQDRLLKVMDNYHYWLAHLAESDRKNVIETHGDERLAAIKKIKDREWIETLPKSYRDDYQNATNALERITLVQQWRAEQKDRRQAWDFFVNSRKDPIPAPFHKAEFLQHVETYAKNLETQVTPAERDHLRRLREAPTEQRDWYQFGRAMVELSQKYTLLPCRQEGPKKYDELPKSLRDKLESTMPKVFNGKKLPKELNSVEGRWPEFAIAVTDYAHRHKIALADPLGPASKVAMPPELQNAIKKLEDAVRLAERELGDKAERARKDVRALKDAENKWPEYPRTLMELAKHYEIPMPGWTLPGSVQIWNRFRLTKPTRKG